MTEDPVLRQELSQRIQSRRANIRTLLQRARPRRNRLANLSIVGSAVAAVLTAGPAIGGQTFTATLQSRLGLADDSTAWRLLCLGAFLLSLFAAIATDLSNSRDLAGRVSAGESCNAELEGLPTLLDFAQLPIPEAADSWPTCPAELVVVAG